MNKNFKKKSKINNLLIRKLSSLIGKNRYRRRSKLNAVPYSIKSKPQKYGPGRNLCVINAIYTLNSSTGYRFDLNTQLLNNSEFSTKKLYYRYFKVLEVRAIFPASGKNTDAIHYLNLSWNSIEESYEDIVKDDSSKMVSYYRPRTRTFRWRPIRSTINVNSIQQQVPINFMNISEFISTDRVVSFPGWLYVTNTSESDQVMIEIVVEFRGNDFGSAPKLSKLNEMKLLIKKWEKELEKRKEINKEFKIINPLPAENFSKEEEEKMKEEIKEENEENEEEIEEEFEENKNNNNNKINDKNKLENKLENVNLNKEKLIERIRESKLTNSRIKDIDNLQPLNIKKEILGKILKEDKSFTDIEDPIFPLKYYENNNQESRTGKEEIIDKLNIKIPIFTETEIKRGINSTSKEKKLKMKLPNKHLLGETSFESLLQNKISEIT